MNQPWQHFSLCHSPACSGNAGGRVGPGRRPGRLLWAEPAKMMSNSSSQHFRLHSKVIGRPWHAVHSNMMCSETHLVWIWWGSVHWLWFLQETSASKHKEREHQQVAEWSSLWFGASGRVALPEANIHQRWASGWAEPRPSSWTPDPSDSPTRTGWTPAGLKQRQGGNCSKSSFLSSSSVPAGTRRAQNTRAQRFTSKSLHLI